MFPLLAAEEMKQLLRLIFDNFSALLEQWKIDETCVQTERVLAPRMYCVGGKEMEIKGTRDTTAHPSQTGRDPGKVFAVTIIASVTITATTTGASIMQAPL